MDVVRESVIPPTASRISGRNFNIASVSWRLRKNIYLVGQHGTRSTYREIQREAVRWRNPLRAAQRDLREGPAGSQALRRLEKHTFQLRYGRVRMWFLATALVPGEQVRGTEALNAGAFRLMKPVHGAPGRSRLTQPCCYHELYARGSTDGAISTVTTPCDRGWKVRFAPSPAVRRANLAAVRGLSATWRPPSYHTADDFDLWGRL